MSTQNFRPSFSHIRPVINAVNTNPIMYPPVIPKIAPSPELNCAKTGMPIIPRIMYITILRVPFLHPRTPPAINIARVCRVKGIVGDGIIICENIAISAVKSDTITISFTDDFRFDFFRNLTRFMHNEIPPFVQVYKILKFPCYNTVNEQSNGFKN